MKKERKNKVNHFLLKISLITLCLLLLSIVPKYVSSNPPGTKTSPPKKGDPLTIKGHIIRVLYWSDYGTDDYTADCMAILKTQGEKGIKLYAKYAITNPKPFSQVCSLLDEAYNSDLEVGY